MALTACVVLRRAPEWDVSQEERREMRQHVQTRIPSHATFTEVQHSRASVLAPQALATPSPICLGGPPASELMGLGWGGGPPPAPQDHRLSEAPKRHCPNPSNVILPLFSSSAFCPENHVLLVGLKISLSHVMVWDR